MVVTTRSAVLLYFYLPLARICFVCQGRSGSSNRLQLLFRGEKEKNPFSPPFYYWKVFRRVRDFIVWLFHLYVESPLFWWFSCFCNAEISLLNSRYWFFKSLQNKFNNILSSSQLTSIMFSWVISYLNLHVLPLLNTQEEIYEPSKAQQESNVRAIK